MAITTETYTEIELESLKAKPTIHPVQEGSSSQHPVEPVTSEPLSNVSSVPAPGHLFPEGGWRAYSVVLGSFLGLIVNFGSINSIGAIQTYISTHQLAGINNSTVSWIFSIYLFISFALCMFVGPYFDRKGPLAPLILGTLLVFGGYMAVGSSHTVWQFILSLSVCVGVGNAMCISPLVGVVGHWFLVKRGRATGLATLGGSVGGIVIPLLLSSLYPKTGFVTALRVLACFCLGLMIFSIVLAKDRLRTDRDPIVETEDHISKRKQVLVNARDFFNFKALRELKYTLLIAGVFFTELSLMCMVTYYASYAIARGMPESNAYLLLTIFNATGILGRILPGYLSDYLGHFNVNILMLIGYNLSIFLLWIPFGGNFAVLHANAAIAGFFSSSILSLAPVCLGTITPVENFGQRYGLLYFFASIGNLFGMPVGAAIIGKGSVHNYNLFALFCGMFAIAGTFSWYASRYCIVGLKLNVKV
ncbi:MFS general substrate transporter [Suhomyces tanzawaensis NRRL Y-17324]|uniref:MFS general substrate transporter n=1 Tax=Suhomyces tanzawaensis NRRL Y-17324 TaxID=984487 RepID=A0A1E4SND3_9ASCO|nr:MFS general substrate transporter [Suhomyces tanzawaensis NRRL Y-17324]ODV81034.1 MFS general substrate transporter [Suhomyces tanzawaensis NRRL Y-17324]